jgi:hypothetical protein
MHVIYDIEVVVVAVVVNLCQLVSLFIDCVVVTAAMATFCMALRVKDKRNYLRETARNVERE